MRFHRVWAVARKEFFHVIRDARSLGMGIAIPLLLMLLFGFALTLDVDNVPMVVWDQSQTRNSRDFLSRFDGSRYFSIRAYVRNYRELERAIASGQAMTALVIPRDFAGRIEAGRTASVQLLVDGSDANTATIASGYADAVGQTYSQEVAIETVRKRGGRGLQPPIDLRPRVWFNAELESRNFIVPGLIAVIMMVITALLSSLTIAREWERGTMEQLIATPIKVPELLIGKLLPYFAIGLFDVALAVGLSQWLFHVPLRGSGVLLFGVASLFLIGVLSMGLVISIVAKNQFLASQIAMLSALLPSFLLSGFVFPIASMPVVIRLATHFVPARYLVAVLKGIYLKGVGLRELALDVALLTLFSILMVTLAHLLMKKKLN